MVHHQGDHDAGVEPTYEGAFSYGGDTYHIMRADKYIRVKHQDDPHVQVDESNPGLVIFRDSDQLRSVSMAPPPPSACSHDHLPFNRDPILNPLLRSFPVEDNRAWYSPPWKIFDEMDSMTSPMLGKRQDAIGDGSDNK
jgi:hypothetical protein